MSQPPYPPAGGNEPGDGRPGAAGWGPPGGSDDPTQPFGPAGQREPTQQFPPGQYGPPGQQPPYGPAGQPPYWQPGPYGQQPPYGRPLGQPGDQPPKGSRTTVIALVVAAVVVLAAVGVALWLLFGRDNGTTFTGSTSGAGTSTQEPPSAGGAIPPPTVTPDGLGDDPVFNEYARDCYDGIMDACDSLFLESETDSLYEAYGDTCAGRQRLGSDVSCTDSFPGG
jgi:hypothetical protein